MVQEELLEGTEAIFMALQRGAIHTLLVGMVPEILMPAVEGEVSGESHHLGKQGMDCPTGRVRDESDYSEGQYQ